MTESTQSPPRRKGLELLASVKSVDVAGAVTNKCFGNILELGWDMLVLESHLEQSAGAAVMLNLVFPGQRIPKRNPIVTLHCVVRRVRDRARLHYELAIEDMDDAARKSLLEFLQVGAEGRTG